MMMMMVLVVLVVVETWVTAARTKLHDLCLFLRICIKIIITTFPEHFIRFPLARFCFSRPRIYAFFFLHDYLWGRFTF